MKVSPPIIQSGRNSAILPARVAKRFSLENLIGLYTNVLALKLPKN
jgi:hypothetical protein